MPDQIDDKATARSRFVNNRRALGNRERARQSALAVRRLLAEPLLTSAKTVAAYWPLGIEPDPRGLFGEVLARGAEVLLPVVLPDRDLDWASYAGDADALAEAGAGTLAPAGRRLGVEAVLGAQVLLVPALAVTPMGVRLGRGGGSYDRVLARLANAAASGLDVPWTCALLYDGELGTLGPGAVEPHDRAVNAACTASRLHEFHSL